MVCTRQDVCAGKKERIEVAIEDQPAYVVVCEKHAPMMK